MASAASHFPQWHDERLRYQVLRFVHDQVGHDCDAFVASPQIGRALAIDDAELLRVIDWLHQYGYVRSSGVRPSVCITRLGIAYLETLAGRRRSLRNLP